LQHYVPNGTTGDVPAGPNGNQLCRNEVFCAGELSLRLAEPDIPRRIAYNLHAKDGGDRLRQGFERPTDAMPGYLMQLVKKRREKNNCQL
jgi:hypothetical protein